MAGTMDEYVAGIVKDIREHPLLGRGSCSSVDEAMTDDELAEDVRAFLDDGRCPTEIIDELIDSERIYWERQGITWPEK